MDIRFIKTINNQYLQDADHTIFALDLDTAVDGMAIAITCTAPYPYAAPPLDNVCDLQKTATAFHWNSVAVTGAGTTRTSWSMLHLKLIYDSTSGTLKWKLYLYSFARPNPFASGFFNEIAYWTAYKPFTSVDPLPTGTYSSFTCNLATPRFTINSAIISLP